MLNRQLLRIKAMKALYAFRQSQSSDFHLGIDLIEQDFEPDYLQETPPDEKQLALDAKKAIELYKKYYKEVQPVVEEPVEPKIRGAVMKAVKNYHQTVLKDKKHHFQLMLDEVEQIYDQYLAMLLLLQKLSELAKEELKLKVERVKTGNPVAPHHFKFSENSFVKYMKNDRELMQQIEKRRVRIDEDFIRTTYRHLKNLPEYIAYSECKETDFAADKALCEEIVKELFFKDETVFKFFEEENINWEENKSSLRSMVLKTIKNTESNTAVSMAALSKNWDDDRSFFVDCYQLTLEDEKKYEDFIGSHLRNWDFERVALVDKVILSMALSEMFNCSSIPLKVTINEYVELAKTYSTPKSREFVNGILDVLSKELSEKGLIKKSGRGLLDNQ
jgi:N utilization substance protein B